MEETAGELRDRARHYRQLATMVTDRQVADAIRALADDLERRSQGADTSGDVTVSADTDNAQR